MVVPCEDVCSTACSLSIEVMFPQSVNCKIGQIALVVGVVMADSSRTLRNQVFSLFFTDNHIKCDLRHINVH